jgi:ABC-type transporter Mla maintaining outer membrane lipid asymmetry ATPase subunit MlaF
MPIFEEPRLEHRIKLGFVFDGGQVFSQLTVAENIALPLRYHGKVASMEVESRVAALLDLTALTPWADRKAGQLGRSWQQRAGLARALGLQPEVLLLDSPLTGLDARQTAWWLDVLGQLSRGHGFMGGRRLTLVATADDLRPWRRQADRVAYLANRRLRVLGDWRAAEDSKEAVLRELLLDASPGD